MTNFNQQAMLAMSLVAASLLPAVPAMSALVAPAEPTRIFPGEHGSDATTTQGILGDGTLGNDSWLVGTGTSGREKLYPHGLLYDDGPLDIRIRDIVRMSLDTKRPGDFFANDFLLQIETVPDANDAFETIVLVLDNGSDNASAVDDSGSFVPNAWNTYEWNRSGNALTGLEGKLHQHEGTPENGGNGQTNPWYTLKETLDLAGDPASAYYGWLDEVINTVDIVAWDVNGTEFASQIDNFTFTYEVGGVEHTSVVDFAAVPEPASLALLAIGGGVALLRRGRKA